MSRAYEYRHVVGFEETNLVGNVYYVNHLKWQGRCREMFIREHAPDVVDRLQDDLALATVRCSCDYIEELRAFDTITIAMRLTSLARTRLTMAFDYFKGERARVLVARGEQAIACMRREHGHMVPAALPETLVAALEPYRDEAASTAAIGAASTLAWEVR
jgi:enediyne biosynthesis thioesterase